jgi:hypothetical protein
LVKRTVRFCPRAPPVLQARNTSIAIERAFSPTFATELMVSPSEF